jgi:hypothetical protein
VAAAVATQLAKRGGVTGGCSSPSATPLLAYSPPRDVLGVTGSVLAVALVVVVAVGFYHRRRRRL